MIRGDQQYQQFNLQKNNWLGVTCFLCVLLCAAAVEVSGVAVVPAAESLGPLLSERLASRTAGNGGDKLRLSSVGDSITHGTCSSAPNATYPADLQRILGADLWLVQNFGASGRTALRHGLSALSNGSFVNASYWDTDEYKQALASQPDIVTIMLGTNDSKKFNWYGVQQQQNDSFVADLKDLVRSFQQLPSSPLVVLMMPPPLYKPVYDMCENVVNELLPAIIPGISRNLSLPYPIDVFDALGGKSLSQPDVTCDGCHPKDGGYLEIAEAMAKRLLTL